MFLTPMPRTLPYKDKYMQILDDVKYRDKNGHVWLTPAGWISDGASLPWITQWKWKPFDPRYVQAAFVHDARFSAHDATFKDSNSLFYEALKELKWEYAKLFYIAVSSPLGWYSYHIIPNLPENEPLCEVIRKFNEEQDALRRCVFAPYTHSGV